MNQKLCPTQLNYLDLVSNELRDFPENNSEVLNLIQSRKNSFNRFKREFLKNIDSIKNKNLKAFALLVSTRFQDDDFLNILNTKFDYDLLNNELANFAKGIYYLHKKENFKAINLLWKIFIDNKNLFTKDDFIALNDLLQYFGVSSKQNELLNYLLNNFPYELVYHQKIVFFYTLIFYDQITIFSKNNLNSLINKELDFLYNYSKTADDFQLLSQYFYNFNKVEKFIECNEKAFLLLNIKNPTTKHLDNFNTRIDNVRNTFNSQLCLDSVNDVLDILNNMGIKAFPDGGTLLGLYRDGKLMDYDHDADLGILVNNEIKENIKKITENIIQEIDLKSKYKFNIFSVHSNGFYYMIALRSELVCIDIIYYHQNYFNEENNTKYYGGFIKKWCPMFWCYDDFYLTKQTLANKEYWLPNNIEKQLEQVYGLTWKQHLSNWDSSVSCPNIPPQSKYAVFDTGINSLYDNLKLNNYERANYYYNELQRWEYPFTDAMKNHIENYLQQIKNNK